MIHVINAKKLNPHFGLMFRKPQIALLENKRNDRSPISMGCVFFDIDCFFLDENYEVVEIKRGLRRLGGFYKPKNNFRYLIETPTDCLDEVTLKDRLSILL